MQISIDGLDINGKLLNLLTDGQKEYNPYAPEPLSLGSCGIQVLMVPTILKKYNNWQLDKLIKNYRRIFKKFLPTHTDYLQGNNLNKLHEGRGKNYLISLTFFGQYWLENYYQDY